MGADIVVSGNRVILMPNGELRPMDLTVPGDFSSATFPLCAGALAGGTVTLKATIGNLDEYRYCTMKVASDDDHQAPLD